jgi:hypothetical protein
MPRASIGQVRTKRQSDTNQLIRERKGREMNRRLSVALKVVSVALIAAATAVQIVSSPATAAPPDATHLVTLMLKPTTGVHPADDSKSWSLDSDAHDGDCTMFTGATWTLTRPTWFSFDATVTSSDNNDTFNMQIQLEDANHAVIGDVGTANDPANHNFSIFMPDHRAQYRWTDGGGSQVRQPLGYDDVQYIAVHLQC